MKEIPVEVHGLSRAIFSTLLNYPVPNRNGKIMLTIYRNKISKLTYIYGFHEGKFKLLGIKYELLNADHFSVNFNEKLQSVQTLLSDWSLRNLSLVGKVTVVKTLAFPILVQILTVLPNPSMQVLKRFQTVFNSTSYGTGKLIK